jgi:hypothetical protein
MKKIICGFKFSIESNTWEKSILSLNYKAINSIFKLPMKGANVPTKDFIVKIWEDCLKLAKKTIMFWIMVM